MDCGFYLASFWLALGCMGLAALVCELWAWRLSRRLRGRLRLAFRLDIRGLEQEERARLLAAARALCRLRWPGGVLLGQIGKEGDYGTETAGRREDPGRGADGDFPE